MQLRSFRVLCQRSGRCRQEPISADYSIVSDRADAPAIAVRDAATYPAIRCSCTATSCAAASGCAAPRPCRHHRCAASRRRTSATRSAASNTLPISALLRFWAFPPLPSATCSVALAVADCRVWSAGLWHEARCLFMAGLRPPGSNPRRTSEGQPRPSQDDPEPPDDIFKHTGN